MSNFIMIVAVLKILISGVEALIRLWVRKNSAGAPDMINNNLWVVQMLGSCILLTITLVLFCLMRLRLKHEIALVPKEDRRDMAKLQEEFFGVDNSSLSASSIYKLLQIWAVIFIGAELVYDLSSVIYRRFIIMLMEMLASAGGETGSSFVILYNITHGFKYLEIVTALLIGVAMTGIFLSDRVLKYAAMIIAIIFLVCFAFLRMHTVLILGKEIGIVWTSVIYHFTETLGLILLSLYLSKKYKGL